MGKAVAPAAKSVGRKRGAAVSSPSVAARASGSEAEDLREYLREWRRTMSKEKGVPAYIVLHDSSLEEICRKQPKYFAELLEIPGIGERKAEMYGQEILDALEKFRAGTRAGWKLREAKPADETLRLLNDGKTLEEIAQIRGRQLSTITGTVASLIETGQVEFDAAWVSKEKQAVIEAACAQVGMEPLKALKDVLPPEISYDEIKLVVGRVRREGKAKAGVSG